MGADANELVGMSQNSLSGLEYDNRVIFGDILEQFNAVFIAPILVRYRLERAVEIARHVRRVKRVVHPCRFGLIFLLIKIMTERKV